MCSSPRTARTIACSALLLSAPLLAAAQSFPSLSSSIAGQRTGLIYAGFADGQLLRDSKTLPLEAGSPVLIGDRIHTNVSAAIVSLNERTFISMRPGTHIEVQTAYRIYLTQGRIALLINEPYPDGATTTSDAARPEPLFTVSTPSGDINFPTGDYDLTATSLTLDSPTTLLVNQGHAIVHTHDRTFECESGDSWIWSTGAEQETTAKPFDQYVEEARQRHTREATRQAVPRQARRVPTRHSATTDSSSNAAYRDDEGKSFDTYVEEARARQARERDDVETATGWQEATRHQSRASARSASSYTATSSPTPEPASARSSEPDVATERSTSSSGYAIPRHSSSSSSSNSDSSTSGSSSSNATPRSSDSSSSSSTSSSKSSGTPRRHP